jgi:hypothetical protein
MPQNYFIPIRFLWLTLLAASLSFESELVSVYDQSKICFKTIACYLLILLAIQKKSIRIDNVIKGIFCENKIIDICPFAFICIRLPEVSGNYQGHG